MCHSFVLVDSDVVRRRCDPDVSDMETSGQVDFSLDGVLRCEPSVVTDRPTRSKRRKTTGTETGELKGTDGPKTGSYGTTRTRGIPDEGVRVEGK